MGRILIVAICGAVLATGVGGLSSQSAVDRQTVKSPHSQESGKSNRSPDQPPLEVSVVETTAQSVSSKKRETKSEEHERLDLEAQEKAANAAYFAAWFSGIGTLLVFGALVQNSRANMRQHRAYITLKQAVLSPLIADQKIDIQLSFMNSGPTPAYSVNTHAYAWLGDGNAGALPAQNLGWQSVNQVVGGQEPHNFAAHLDPRPTTTDIQLIFSDQKMIYVYARVEYRDVFKRKRFTEATLQSFPIIMKGQMKLQFATTDHGNGAN